MASLVLVSTRAAFVALSPNFAVLFLSHLGLPSHWARTATSAELTRWPWPRTSCRSGLLMTSAERGRQEGNGVSPTSGKARLQQPGRRRDRNVWEAWCETAGTEGAVSDGPQEGLGGLFPARSGDSVSCRPFTWAAPGLVCQLVTFGTCLSRCRWGFRL